MANLRLQSILKHEVDSVCKENKCKPSIGFIRLMLDRVLELNKVDIDESITDGSMDKGIDAVFKQENEDGENTLVNIFLLILVSYFNNFSSRMRQIDTRT